MDQPTLTGRLLVAAPLLQEDSFRRSVVFVVDDAADGTLGVILNRPLDTAVEDVVTDWGLFASEPPVMFSGGPVATESGIALGARRARTGARWGPEGPPGIHRIHRLEQRPTGRGDRGRRLARGGGDRR